MSEHENEPTPFVKAGGDAKKGWIVEVNDGTNAGVYSPAAPDADAAGKMALAEHNERFQDAGTDEDLIAGFEGRIAALEAAVWPAKINEPIGHAAATQPAQVAVKLPPAAVPPPVAAANDPKGKPPAA